MGVRSSHSTLTSTLASRAIHPNRIRSRRHALSRAALAAGHAGNSGGGLPGGGCTSTPISIATPEASPCGAAAESSTSGGRPRCARVGRSAGSSHASHRGGGTQEGQKTSPKLRRQPRSNGLLPCSNHVPRT